MAVHKYTVVMFLVAGLATSYAGDADNTATGGKATTEEHKLIENVNASFTGAMAATTNVPPADKYKTFEAAFTAPFKGNLAAAVSKAPKLAPRLDDAYSAAYKAAERAAPEDKYKAFIHHFRQALRIIAGGGARIRP